MANNYLDSVLSVLPATQARQISELLQGLQAAGRIRNKDEYAKTLAELSLLISNKNPTPLFSPIYSKVWSLCSSEAQNLMNKTIIADLEAAFLQVNEIGEKLEDHHVLYLNNLLKQLEKGLTSQEQEIKKLEWLSDYNNEFTHALVNSFDSASNFRLSPTESNIKYLFFNNRTTELLGTTNIPSAVVSDSDSLILENNNSTIKIYPTSIKTQTDQYSYITERQVDVDTDISNLIDGKINTFWTYNVYLMDSVPEVHIILNCSFGNSRDINYMVLEPGSQEPLYITNIDGIAVNGDRINLLYQDVQINKKTRINFTRANLTNILITLSTKTFRRGEYITTVTTEADEDSDLLEKSNSLADITREVINSNTISGMCNIPEAHYLQTNHNIYSFVLDNIWFGNSLYKDIGIFVSEPLSISNLGLIAVNTKEKAESGIIRNSIEYDLIKIDKYPKHKETKIAIPKLNQTAVYSERVIPVKKTISALLNNVAKLRFLPNLSEDIKLYKNGILQTLGTNWTFAIGEILDNSSSPSFNWTSNLNTSYLNYNVVPLGFYIKINNIDSRATYTINYTIFDSETLDNGSYKTIWLDTNKTVSLLKNGYIHFEKDNTSHINTDLFLQITLRRNNSSRSESPELYEYVLLANKYNE